MIRKATAAEARHGGKHVTIHNVAEMAGVSTSTVSRAMNGSGPVSVKSARVVWKAIRELNYAPDPAAQALALRRMRRSRL